MLTTRGSSRGRDWLEPAARGWSFSHFEEVVTTVPIANGGPSAPLASSAGALSETSEVMFSDMPSVHLSEFLERTSTDAFLVVHGGLVVFERYFGEAGPERRHVLMSVSKSVGAMAVGSVMADGVLDRESDVATYVPELSASAYGSATVSQLLDMTAALEFSQDMGDPSSDLQRMDRVAGWRPRCAGDPPNCRAFLATLRPNGPHGRSFQYCSATTDVLSWVAERAASTPYAELLSERVWSRIGAEQPAVVSVDAEGSPYTCGGIAATARDIARFGLCVLRSGRVLGAQVLPEPFIADTRRGSRAVVVDQDFVALHPSGSYRNQWWVTGDQSGSFLAKGVFGQYLWIDPAREVVIVKFSSQAGPSEDRALHDGAFAAIAALASGKD